MKLTNDSFDYEHSHNVYKCKKQNEKLSEFFNMGSKILNIRIDHFSYFTFNVFKKKKDLSKILEKEVDFIKYKNGEPVDFEREEGPREIYTSITRSMLVSKSAKHHYDKKMLEYKEEKNKIDEINSYRENVFKKEREKFY